MTNQRIEDLLNLCDVYPGDMLNITEPELRDLLATAQLVAAGEAAAVGAKIVIDYYFEQQDRDPSNNDNYCRLLDWIKAARKIVK